jgi:hypothetical protein
MAPIKTDIGNCTITAPIVPPMTIMAAGPPTIAPR